MVIPQCLVILGIESFSGNPHDSQKKKFRRRAAIEPVIGFLKQHFRMEQNYLSGDKSPKINALLAAAAWNFKKLMEKIKQKGKNFFFEILRQLFFIEIPNLKTSY